MKKFFFGLLIVLHLSFCLVDLARADLPGSDSFNNWELFEFDSGRLRFNNGRVEYSCSEPNESGNTAVLYWVKGTASYSIDWEASVETYVPKFSNPSNAYVGIALYAFWPDARIGGLVNAAGVEFQRIDDTTDNWVDGDKITDGNDQDPNKDGTWQAIDSNNVSLRINWDASTEELKLYYDPNGGKDSWVFLGSRVYDVDDWSMGAADSFYIGVNVFALRRAMDWSDGIAFDDFQVSFGDSVEYVEISDWTWISGASEVNQPGVYGVMGITHANNIPGARSDSTSWTDSNDSFYLFGGVGYDNTGSSLGYLNDLWKFDGTNWTWVSGSNTANQAGVYGVKGVANPSNVPGARSNSVSWIDSSGNFWLFGGGGYDSTGSAGYLNDLWKFDGTSWTWVSGSNTGNQVGVYGTKGVSNASNIPGARIKSVSWVDNNGNFWFFGGYGYDSTILGSQNDLWKFDGTNWTWVSGDNIVDQIGVYGMKGVTNSNNMPRSRANAVSWIDSSGNFWLWGGAYDIFNPSPTILNDLWRFNGTNWTWVSGSSIGNQAGVYGIKGVSNPANISGSKLAGNSWTEDNNIFWLFGGHGYDDAGSKGYLNDLWRFRICENPPVGDLNSDCKVNFLDFSIMASYWLEGTQ